MKRITYKGTFVVAVVTLEVILSIISIYLHARLDVCGNACFTAMFLLWYFESFNAKFWKDDAMFWEDNAKFWENNATDWRERVLYRRDGQR